MATFPPDPAPPQPPQTPLPQNVPVIPQPAPDRPAPARLIRPRGKGGGYGEDMTLAALMARQKELADQAQGVAGMNAGTIPQGLAMLANSFVNALQRRQAERAATEAQGEISNALATGLNQDTGQLSPEASAVLWRRDPETAMELMKTAMTLRASAGKQGAYGPVITGDAAAKVGLDPAGHYQLNSTTGQYDPVSTGAGQNITVGTGEKLSESLVKDTTYYPGARNANLDLEDLDNFLTSTPGALAGFVPGGQFLTSADYQRAKVAGDAWIQNVLRRESGATIPADEMEANRKTYLPQPGDDAGTIAYKRQLRQEKTATLRYGLEAAAPETLKKIDDAYEASKAARAERRRAAAGGGGGGGGDGGAGAGADANAAPSSDELAFVPPMPKDYDPKDWPSQKEWDGYTPEQKAAFIKLSKSGAGK